MLGIEDKCPAKKNCTQRERKNNSAEQQCAYQRRIVLVDHRTTAQNMPLSLELLAVALVTDAEFWTTFPSPRSTCAMLNGV